MLHVKDAVLAMVDVNNVAKAVFNAAAKGWHHGKNYFLSSESWKISDISHMLNNRKPAGKPRAIYSNRLAKMDLNMNFKPVRKPLNKFRLRDSKFF